MLDQAGQGQHQGVAGVDQVAVAGRQVPLQLGVDCQQVPVEQVGAVLGLLEAQGRLHPRQELHQAERLGEVVVGPGHQHLGHLVGRGVAGET